MTNNKPADAGNADAVAVMRWAGAPVDAEREAGLARRLNSFRQVLRHLDGVYATETEPIGLRVPPAERGQ